MTNYDILKEYEAHKTPVPSYEEWQASYNCMLENEVLRLKNAQLKEQINKCCLDAINRGTANAVKAVKEFGMPERIKELVKQNKELKERCERLEKQLEIAVEQLKDTYIICFRNKDTLLHTPEHNIIGGIERDCAIALQQIKELKQNE